jgi:hypothetical protein
MAEKSSWDQANRWQKLGLSWRNRKKSSQLIKEYYRLTQLKKKLNLRVKGERAEVGEEVAGGAVEVAPAHVRRYPHLILHVEDKKKNLCNQSILLRWRPHMYAAIFTSSCRLKKKIKKTLQSINSVEMAPSHVRRHPHLILHGEEKIKINQSMLLRLRPHMYTAILTSSCKLKKK